MKLEINHIVFKNICKIVTNDNLNAYVIGGYVRDLILKRKSNDIDIVVVGSGINLAKKVAMSINKNISVNIFKNFGTAMFKYNNDEIEFVGARKESYQRNSRKPFVESGSLVDDQNRRDFTINALAISLNKDDFGQLIDPFNGMEDLKNGIIKTPLNPITTFSDDPLRMLRAIRFASQLDFTVSDETLEAIGKIKNRISIISKERISSELNKIILSKKPSKGFILLEKTGLLKLIFPLLDKMKGVNIINGKAHKDNFIHTIQVLDNISQKTDNLWLRWAAVLHDIGKPATKKFQNNNWTFYNHSFVGAKMVPDIFRFLKLPLNSKMKYVQKLVLLHLRPIGLADSEINDSAIRRLLFETGDDIDDLMTLCEADITSKNDKKVKYFLENFTTVRTKLKEIEQKDTIRNFQPPISGDFIIKTFNIKPSREIGIIKDSITNAILDGKINNNFDEAFSYMIIEAKKLGLKQI